MGRLSNKSVKDQAAYNLLLDSGLRLVEVSRLLSSLPEAEKVGGLLPVSSWTVLHAA